VALLLADGQYDEGNCRRPPSQHQYS